MKRKLVNPSSQYDKIVNENLEAVIPALIEQAGGVIALYCSVARAGSIA